MAGGAGAALDVTCGTLPHVDAVRGTGVPDLVAARVDASGEPRQRAVGDAEGLGDLALATECVHPLDGVPGGEIFKEEAGQPVGQASLYCCEFGVMHDGGSCHCVT